MENIQLSLGIDQPAVKKRKGLLEQIAILKKEGKTSTAEFTQKMRELEEILGVNQINPFGTNELDIFVEDIQDMTNADLQSLATRFGITSSQERPALKKLLIKEFKNYNRDTMRNVMPGAVDTFKLDPKNPNHAATIKILGEF